MKNKLSTLFSKYSDVIAILKSLEKVSDIYLIGGVLREYREHNSINHLRDLDIIISIKNYQLFKNILNKYIITINRFNGYKIKCNNLDIDLWAIENTWAFSSKTIICDKKDYVKYLPYTVFLNIDSIIYDWSQNIWYDKEYKKAMNSKILDVILEKNPALISNLSRALVKKKYYNFKLFDKLINLFNNEFRKENNLELFVDKLYKEQLRRYQIPILSVEQLKSEIQQIIDL